MSDAFLKVARDEIQSEVASLKEIFRVCVNDEQLYKNSTDIERHMHKIKGLAPMMGQEKVGEIARISHIILKHIINHGVLKGSHDIILKAVQIMSYCLKENVDMDKDDFRKQVISAYPELTGF